ncbi:hypothetical protein [Xenophilus sp. Marseille-Q4582]|uniref:hypothetical protein n=1 Tax=Xenophilus sp. Marseille-Q4582 TaxID=2866600 RepID=UPI001CE4A07F|nr:hypothetical protein [Xenophilus sp. Marseille-Q4582]
MAIKIKVNQVGNAEPEQFPALRMWKEDYEKGISNPLVVLFTAPKEGVAISGSPTGNDSGVWIPFDSEKWIKCSITMTSVN